MISIILAIYSSLVVLWWNPNCSSIGVLLFSKFVFITVLISFSHNFASYYWSVMFGIVNLFSWFVCWSILCFLPAHGKVIDLNAFLYMLCNRIIIIGSFWSVCSGFRLHPQGFLIAFHFLWSYLYFSLFLVGLDNISSLLFFIDLVHSSCSSSLGSTCSCFTVRIYLCLLV